VLVTRNDHGLGLYNGDIGIAMPGEQSLGVMFPAAGGLRRVGLARLPAHQSAWAMTVHKAQGSEAARVVLVLPPAQSPALCRELLYTGITRATERLVLCASEEALRAALARPLRRHSGLAGRLRAV
jgi:exodeoxyribonuclease V alpha subunit